jgi:hypothetical protein
MLPQYAIASPPVGIANYCIIYRGQINFTGLLIQLKDQSADEGNMMNTFNKLLHESYDPEKCDQHCKNAALFLVSASIYTIIATFKTFVSSFICSLSSANCRRKLKVAHVEKHAEIQKINATG